MNYDFVIRRNGPRGRIFLVKALTYEGQQWLWANKPKGPGRSWSGSGLLVQGEAIIALVQEMAAAGLAIAPLA